MLETLEDEARPRQKPKMEVLLVKSAEVRVVVAWCDVVRKHDGDAAGQERRGARAICRC